MSEEKVFTDVMIDLETMGKGDDAAIMSIGAVVFNPSTGEIASSYHAKIDLQSCMDLGLSIDASTIEWWLRQEKEAQEELLKGLPATEVEHNDDGTITVYPAGGEPVNERDNIREALVGLGSWLHDLTVGKTLKLERVWGNGATFDITILENAMSKFSAFYGHLLPPWEFWAHRDVRTLRDIAVAAGCEDYKESLPFEGVKHDALADAKFQADYVSLFWQWLMESGGNQNVDK